MEFGTITLCFDFNPRSREGSDRLIRHPMRQQATFQSTLPRRERRQRQAEGIAEAKFQSTLPRRERRRGSGLSYVLDHFNPRSREGSDYLQ